MVGSRDDLNNPDRDCWTGNHRQHLDALLGREVGGYRLGRIKALSDAPTGFFHNLDKADGKGLDGMARSDWARAELNRMIEAEYARLGGVLRSMDRGPIDADRAEAADRALFDPSKEAILARKYEAATERAMYRALKEFRQVEAEAEEGTNSNITVDTDETCDPLALNGREDEGEATEADPEPSSTPRTVPPALPIPRSMGLPAVDPPVDGPTTDEGPVLALFEGVISV